MRRSAADAADGAEPDRAGHRRPRARSSPTQTPSGNEADPSYWKAGQKLYRNGDAARGIPACASCHGPVGRGNPAAGYPALQAQHAVYTVKQLDGYATGTRYAKDASRQAPGQRERADDDHRRRAADR